ncbi:MAG: MFS transporter [Acidimicrobiia bacterium]
MAGTLDRLYSTLVEDEDDHGCRELPESSCRVVPGNAVRLVAGFTLQKLGDRIADPKTVLAWMLTSLGAPGFVIAMLVPIRESGALLPQAALVPIVRRFGLRSRVWAGGAVGQSVAIAGIGFAGATLTGLGAGIATLVALAGFSLARAVSSITAKDVIGKTIPRGNRGSVTGIAASAAGLVAIGAGVVIAITAQDADASLLALIVGMASLLWLGAAGVFLTVDEVPSSAEETDPAASIKESMSLSRDDAPFRRFIVARILLLVTALSPPFVVSLSAAVSESSISGVGPFVVATGVAGLLGSPVWGRLADQSSRLVMAAAAGAGGMIVLGYLSLRWIGFDSTAWLGPAAYLLLAVAHAGARMGRKTYVVDLGRGETRTRYVAVSNTIIGVVLLAVGLIGAALAQIGAEWSLLGLAVTGLAGSVMALGLPEIHD